MPDHAELEVAIGTEGRELLRQLFQDHLDLRAEREQRVEGVVDCDGVCHGSVEADHDRPLSSVFGEVRVRRLAYRHRGRTNLYRADAALNLPPEKHSHGLRELAATESTRGPSTTLSRPSNVAAASDSGNAKSRTSPNAPPSTSTTSTPAATGPSPPTVT